MGHIFCLMGKSACGKDTLYNRLINDSTLGLSRIVSYTTRPVREGEKQGVEYFFTDIEGFTKLKEDGKVIEYRVYHTFYGDWYYFTVDDGSINLAGNDYLYISTLESYEKLSVYFGRQAVIPLYIEIDDGIRLERALSRERKQASPKYEEMCRRFLADSEDFCEERLNSLNINERYPNEELDGCLEKLREKIWTLKSIK